MACPIVDMKNPGTACKVDPIKLARRLFVVNLLKKNGEQNKILGTDAVLSTNWTTLFEIKNFESNIDEKIIPLPTLRTYEEAINNENIIDEDGHYKVLYGGDIDATFLWRDIPAQIAANLKSLLEDNANQLGVYIADDEGAMIGVGKNDLNLYPLALKAASIKVRKIPSADGATVEASIRFASPNEHNAVRRVIVSDANGNVVDFGNDNTVSSALNDATAVISSPAVTGCVAAISYDEIKNNDLTAVAVSGIPYTSFVFKKDSDGTLVSLADAGSLTESPDGTYTINEATLLDAASGYTLQINFTGTDIVPPAVAVP